MPIIVASTSTAGSSSATFTVADVLSKARCHTQEMQGTGHNDTLICFTDQIHRLICRKRKWDWMLSATKQFITEYGQGEYWVGTTAGQAAGQVDTLLNLTNVREIQHGNVLDRTGAVELGRQFEPPVSTSLHYPDGTFRFGPPRMYLNDPSAPNILKLFPLPDTGSTYEIVPSPPHSTTAAGGALSARTYFIKVTFVDKAGNESAASAAARQYVEASKLITVKAPQPGLTQGSAGILFDRYNVYASTTEGSETLQNVSPTAITADWTEPGTGLTTTGASAPTDSAIDAIRGYLIQFRYYQTISNLTATTDGLQVPDRYIDVLVSGVVWLMFEQMKDSRASRWQSIFESGLQQMTVDQNPWPANGLFISPDPSSQRVRRLQSF